MRKLRNTAMSGGAAAASSAGRLGSRASTADAAKAKPVTRKRGPKKMRDRDLVFILRNLATLTGSGVSLPKALGTLAEEKALEKHREMLLSIRRHLENGEPFSTALAHYGA